MLTTTATGPDVVVAGGDDADDAADAAGWASPVEMRVAVKAALAAMDRIVLAIIDGLLVGSRQGDPVAP